MPPNRTHEMPHPPLQQQALPLYNPAVIHPVFFSDSWHKPPFPLPFNTAWNPVTAGYAFSNAAGAGAGRGTKL